MTPAAARDLMQSWVQSPALRAHMEAVAACMTDCASRLAPADADRWFIAGILHDFDYEKHPTPAEHPAVGVAHLRTLGLDDETLTAILGHADHTSTPRTTPMAKALYAVDELAGFIVACAKVRPNGIADLEPPSVKKKLKDKAFAANVSRDDIARGIADLAPLYNREAAAFEPEHIKSCIDAIRAERARIGV